MIPKRIQLRRTKGWKMPPNTVVVARPSKWGNPYMVGIDGSAAQCVELYLRLINGNVYNPPNKREAKDELRGKNLACWCPIGAACHADILLELANQ